MAEDTVVKNGKQGIDSALSEQEYRELCKRVRQEQMLRSKKRKSRGVLRSAGTLKDFNIAAKVSESSTDWESLETGTVFSTDNQGVQLFVKSGRYQCRNLRTGKGRSLEGASVYVVYL